MFLNTRVRRHAPFVVAAASAVALDQWSKSLVRSNLAYGESWPEADWIVKLTHGSNAGAAFGLFQGQGALLTIVALAAVVMIVFFQVVQPADQFLARLGLGAILGGTVGNLADRLRAGVVTDFIDFPRYPDFNLADSSIVIGLLLLAAVSLLNPQVRRQNDGP